VDYTGAMKVNRTSQSTTFARDRRWHRLAAGALAASVCAVGALCAHSQSAPPQNVGAVGADAGALPAAKPLRSKIKSAAPKPGAATTVGSATGCGSEGAIGVAREHVIDSTAGPRFGHQQFHDIDFLADGEVVLTFDDGPLRPHTMPVLKALDAHCTKATFFVVGRMAIADPALVRETEKRGHTVGTHTWSHMDLRKTNPARARGEVELGFSAVSKALGHASSPFFRFPYLSSPKGMLDYVRSRRISTFSIEVDSNDYRSKDPAHVHRNVLSQLANKKKGIILFHDIQPSTAGALAGLLDELKARGFKVVHLKASNAVATLPEFDAIAEKEMARKSAVANADPLATRSVVWPVSGAEAVQRAASKVRPPSASVQDEVLPWGVVAGKPAPITVPAPRPKAAPANEMDWATKLFNF